MGLFVTQSLGNLGQMADPHRESNNQENFPESPSIGSGNIPSVDPAPQPVPRPTLSLPVRSLQPSLVLPGETTHAHSHTEPARLILTTGFTPSGYPMTIGEMGNIVMQPPGASTDQWIVVIGNIPFKIKWQDLKDLVRTITPNIERADIYTQDGRSKGFGCVRIKGRIEAGKVQERLDGYVWHGRALMTKLANLEYSCPVPGEDTKSGAAQKPTDHEAYSNASSRQAKVPESRSEVTFPPLPREYHDPTAHPVFPPNASQLDIEMYYQQMYTQAYIHYLFMANFHQRQAEVAWQKAEEHKACGRLGMATECQRESYTHRGASLHANNEASEAQRLAYERQQICIQIRSMDASVPAENITGVQVPFHPGYSLGRYQGATMLSHGAMSLQATAEGTSPFKPFIPPYSNTTWGYIAPMRQLNPEFIAPVQIVVSPLSGLPVNLRHGAVRTECRSVFIKNLAFDTTWRELKDFLKTPIRVDVAKNVVDNRAKGHATATFESSEAAEEACRTFHLSIFKGRQISIRMDRDCTTRKPVIQSQISNVRLGGRGEACADTTKLSSQHADQPTVCAREQRDGEETYRPPLVVDGSSTLSIGGEKMSGNSKKTP